MLLRETRGGLLPPSYLLHSRYSIVSQIGTGGFGAVYQAQDTLFSHRLVAIKEMSQDGLSPRELAEATAAFEHEALVLTNLTHPNLPRIHDHFSEHGRSYVVIDFIAGGTLEDSLDTSQRSFPVEVVLNIGLQLAEALDYLHSQQPPIIFRDLKPANIMRTAGNHVYLIDFGIARHFKPGKAKDTIPLGSKGYAAPEQYGKAQTTPQSDIYGLGATLHQLLTGDDPSLSLFHFAPVRLYSSPISAPLNALLQQMLEMEMDKRPASMTVVKQELQRLLAPQTAQKPGPVVKRRTFVKGCLGVVATCSASIAITTFIVKNPNLVDLLFAHPFSGTTPVPSLSPPAPAQATILSRPLYTYRGHAGSVTAVAWSPHGQNIASAGTLDSSVQVWDANTGNLVLVPRKDKGALFATNNQSVDALAWSPNGSSIAAALGKDTVDIWSIETGDPSTIPFSQPGNVNALAWSPDGGSIAAVSGNTAIQVRSATTGRLSLTYKGHIQIVLTLAWSPDGRQIASGSADGTVRVWDATTGHTYMTYAGHSAEVNTVTWSPDGKYIASGGADGTVQVWDAATGRLLFTYRGHAGAVNTVTWQRGTLLLPWYEARIASGGADATVQVWSVGEADAVVQRWPVGRAGNAQYPQAMALQGELLIYRGHSGPVTSVTWSPDGQLIASGSEDGTVQVWRAI
jgi:WD40 repeat protein